MSTPVEIITLTETLRLVVEYDQSATNPREDGDYHLTGFCEVGRPWMRNSVPGIYVPIAPIIDANEHFWNALETGTEALEATARWARIMHGLVIQWDSDYQGYWFCDLERLAENWPDLVPGSDEHLAKQAEVITSEREHYGKWADGEVYGVILQSAASWVRVDEQGFPDGPERTEWENGDALWGCYLDEDYTAEHVALDHFNLPAEVEAELRERVTK